MRYWTLQAKQFYEAAKRAEETTKELLDEEARKEGLDRKARKAQLPHSELALRLETEGKAAPARASHREDWRLDADWPWDLHHSRAVGKLVQRLVP